MQVRKNKILHLPVLIEQDEDNVFIVSCPIFKGCHSYGHTVEEALANLREVIDICLEEEGEISDQMNRFVGFREMQILVSETIA